MTSVEQLCKASFRNRGSVKTGGQCGCYYCLATFSGCAIVEWTDDGQTALCPRCNIDSVLPGVTDAQLLEAAHAWGFRASEAEQTTP